MALATSTIPFIQTLKTISVAADNIQILSTTKDFKQQLLSLIRSARQRIYLAALYLQDDEAGREILEAIYQAKQANPQLDVKIFVDFLRAQRGLMGQAKSIGNVRLYREMAEKYSHSIDILGVPVKSKEVFGVFHLKGFIFDNTLLYSGASINNVYLHQAERYRYDRYHLIKSPILCNSFAEFLKHEIAEFSAVTPLTGYDIPERKKLLPIIKRFKKLLRASRYHFVPSVDCAAEGEVSLTPLLGYGGRRNQLNNTIFDIIRQTQNHLIVYTPYFNFPLKINRAIRGLLRRGVKVDIVVGDKTANDFYIAEPEAFNKIGIVPYVYEMNLRRFVKKNQRYIDKGLLNLNLWLDNGNTFHLKGICSDYQSYLITGHNLNPRACKLDLENGVLIQDNQKLLQEKFENEFATIITHTTQIKHFEEIEDVNDYPEAPKKLMRSVRRAKLDSILNRLL
ncbi:CDP-diacylglycerol--serine O-phosphatidyltransferase [Aliikangiella maris]|uniref:CDP-diacylglycerol--serine O-phosphatidyltransferase n=2 Tax=Aliikangiella maris TaxID=3162458 RepID=A0ABV3MQX9_9GAMM